MKQQQSFLQVKRYLLLSITSALTILLTTASLQSQSLIPELVFMHPQLQTGSGCSAGGRDGAVYIFRNVGMGIDALLTIQGRSSEAVHLTDPDMPGREENAEKGQGFENAWQPRIKYGNGNAPPNTDWWMEFKISFVQHANHFSSVAVNQFFVSGLNVEGDVDEAEDAKVSNFYSGTNTMVVRLGAETGKTGSKTADRTFALMFKSLAYDVPVKATPVNLVASNGEEH